MSYYLSHNSKNNMEGVDSRLQDIVNLAITITKVDFGIPSSGGVRTAGEQNGMYLNGKSKCDGYRKESKHQSGSAIDFYAYVDGRASWEPNHLAMVACSLLQAAAILGVQIEWGGLWRNFTDMPHIQLYGE